MSNNPDHKIGDTFEDGTPIIADTVYHTPEGATIAIGDKVVPMKAELTPEQKAEAAINLEDQDERKSSIYKAAVMVCIAAAGRLQALESRRYPAPGDDLWTPLTPEDQADYHRLKKWWTAWPREKQVRLMLNMKELAYDLTLTEIF